ncbi:hypothetical protein DFH08DRAFT_812798 [Mycena albidolilacea]|uniref:Uncharacterized protein n=1 Tax=Mycena albidolilacea TaxID=1033008 RepID=A0AAD6ZSU5_9AGAR|nr:hypothetical protein DFH08DRAFT_812798 [Mycena albidolilacea]
MRLTLSVPVFVLAAAAAADADKCAVFPETLLPGSAEIAWHLVLNRTVADNEMCCRLVPKQPSWPSAPTSSELDKAGLKSKWILLRRMQAMCKDNIGRLSSRKESRVENADYVYCGTVMARSDDASSNGRKEQNLEIGSCDIYPHSHPWIPGAKL